MVCVSTLVKSLVNTLLAISKDSGPLNLIIVMAPIPVVVDMACYGINSKYIPSFPPFSILAQL